MLVRTNGIAKMVSQYKRYCKSIRAFLGTPFRLRDDIPRDSVTPGLDGTSCMGCGHTAGHAYAGSGLLFPVARERDIRVCAGRVCAGTGFHTYHGTAGFLAGFNCRVVHPTPAHTS